MSNKSNNNSLHVLVQWIDSNTRDVYPIRKIVDSALATKIALANKYDEFLNTVTDIDWDETKKEECAPGELIAFGK